jgi:hypothetical protein
LFLQLFEDLFDWDSVEDILGGRGQDGEYGESAVFLILLEAAAEAIVRISIFSIDTTV